MTSLSSDAEHHDRQRADDDEPAHPGVEVAAQLGLHQRPRPRRRRSARCPCGSRAAPPARCRSGSTAVNAAPGSPQPNSSGKIRRWALLEIGRNSVSPWMSAEDDGLEQVEHEAEAYGRSVRAAPPRRRAVAGIAAVGATSLPPCSSAPSGSTGLQVSRLGLGTMTWGRDTDEHEAREQLSSFVEAGGTLVDTAAGYGDGDVRGADRLADRRRGRPRRAGDRHQGRHLARGPASAVTDTSRGHLLRTLDASLAAARRRPRRPVAGAHLVRRRPRSRRRCRALDYRGDDRPRGVRRRLELHRVADRPGGDLAAGRAGPGAAGLEPGRVLPAQPRHRARGAARGAALGLGVLPWSPLGRGVLTGKYRTGTPADSRGAPRRLRELRRRLPRRARARSWRRSSGPPTAWTGRRWRWR